MGRDKDKAKLAARVEELLAEVPGGLGAQDTAAWLGTKLVPLDLEARLGWVRFAGSSVRGTNLVQFDVGPEGWSSVWPDWAYAAARDALLYQHLLLVISLGLPWGPQLLATLVMDRSS